MFVQVQQALYQNLSARTVLIIAHRLSTVEQAHRIIVIDKGQVVQEGEQKTNRYIAYILNVTVYSLFRKS